MTRAPYQYVVVLLVAVVGYSLSYYLYSAVSHWEESRFEVGFSVNAKDRVSRLKVELASDLKALDASAAYFYSAKKIERDKFAIFTKPFLSFSSSLEALGWTPRVSHANRARFEQRVRSEGFPEFQISEREKQGVMARAADRSEYFPVNYIEPFKGNEAAFGFDLASNPVRLQALLAARDSGEKHATERITLVQETGDHLAFIAFQPVYQHGGSRHSVENRKKSLIGYFSAVFRIDHLLEKSLEAIAPKGLDIHVFDTSAPIEKQFLAFHSSRLREGATNAIKERAELLNSPVQYSETVNVAGRTWLVIASPAPELLAQHISWTPQISFIIALIFVSMLMLYLISLMKRSDRDKQFALDMEQQVAERTATLAVANEQLAKDAIELQMQSQIAKHIDEGISLVRVSDGAMVYTNEKFEQMFGYDPGELNGKHPAILNAPTDRSPEQVAEEIIATLSERGSWRGEVKNVKKDGAVFWTRATITEFKNNEDEELWLNVQKDVTESKFTADKLTVSEMRLWSILDNTTAVIYLKDLEGKYLLVNKRWGELFDISPEEMVGKTDLDVFPKDMADAFQKNDRQVLKENRVIELEEHAPHDDGLHTYVSIKFPVTDANGDLYAVGGISTDISDRAKAETLLKQIQDRHEEAQHVAHIGHWELDLVKNDLVWSNEECLIFGAEDGARNTYETFLDTIHPDDRDYVNQAFTGSVENRTKYDIEHRLLMKDGTIKWVNERCNVYYDEDGTPLRAIGTTQDITDRKQAQARFERIFEQAADAIISIDKEHNIVLFNASAENVFGYSHQEILGQQLSQLLPERYRVVHHQLVEAFATSGDGNQHESRRRVSGLRKNGEEFPIDISISRQMEESSEMTAIIRDMSDHVDAQEMLRKRSAAIEQAGEAVLVTDLNSVIEYVNPAFTEITGYLPEEVIGKTPKVLKSSAQDPAFYEELWKTITSGEVWHGTLIDRKKDGTFYPAMMSVAPIHDDAGEITHYVSLQQDVTEQKRLEQQFLQAQKMESIGTLVGGIAHDFNNILAAVLGNIHLARLKKSDPSAVSTKLENIERLSNRAAEMVRQLLTFARKDKIMMKPFSINSFMKEGFKLAKSAIPENIEHSCDTCQENLIVTGDPTQLQQALMNLLNNARDAVKDVSHPKISCLLVPYQATDKFIERHPELVGVKIGRITVRDNGCGVKKEHLNKVFEPFFTTKAVGEGTGLGLSMVYGAVQTHCGVVEIESEVGKGTAFHLYLPIKDEALRHDEKRETELLMGDGETLLLVDDEDDIRTTTHEILNSLGYVTLEAANGEEALELFNTNRDEIRVVISDVVMPKMGGVDLMKAIHQLDWGIPVLLMTGYDMDKIDGLDDFETVHVMNKPFSMQELSETVQELLMGDKSA